MLLSNSLKAARIPSISWPVAESSIGWATARTVIPSFIRYALRAWWSYWFRAKRSSM
jgi:hypothetical protein